MIHAKYSPSKLHRIIECPGSALLSEYAPEPGTSAYAEEGTLLHAYMVEAMDAFQSIATWHDDYAPDTSNQEHIVLIHNAMQEVADILDGLCGDFGYINDQRVYMSEGVDVNGTVDLVVYSEHELHAIDFKFGAGVEVDAYNNPQLLAYLDGALNDPKIKTLPIQRMFVHIIQPRLDEHKMVEVTSVELEQFRAQVQRAIMLAESKNPPFHSGAHCRWCPCAGTCRTRAKYTQDSALMALSSVSDSMDIQSQMTDIPSLAKILSTRKAVEAGFAAIEQYLKMQLAGGQEVPGFKLVTGRSSRKWVDGTSIEDLEEAFGIEAHEFIKADMMSVAQAEKLLNKEQKERLKSFYEVHDGPVSIAPSASAKPEVILRELALTRLREVTDALQ